MEVDQGNTDEQTLDYGNMLGQLLFAVATRAEAKLVMLELNNGIN
jgi:hypothetical protein